MIRDRLILIFAIAAAFAHLSPASATPSADNSAAEKSAAIEAQSYSAVEIGALPKDRKLANTLLSAMNSISSQKYEEAVQTLSAMLAMPNLPIPAAYQAHYNRAVAFEYLHEYDKAILDIDAELALRPKDTRMLLERAGIYKAQGKLMLVLQDFNAILQVEPDNFRARHGLVAELLAMNDYPDALLAYESRYTGQPETSGMHAPSAINTSSTSNGAADAAASVKPVDLTTLTPQEETQEGIMLPQPLAGSHIYYPPIARRLGLSGRVEVAFTVAATGGVSDPQLLKSSGYVDLDMAALLTVTQWHFEPATQRGKAITARTKMILTFQLAG